jgi:hypothetical protein
MSSSVRPPSRTEAQYPPSPYTYLPECASFDVTSTDVAEGVTLNPAQRSGKFGVPGGKDESPQLSWSGFPADTKSFVVTCYDPDAPTVSGFWHWVCYDIPASITSLPTNAGAEGGAGLPAGAKQVKNDAGFAGFLGAAPPSGHREHRYIFAVSAMPVETLPEAAATSASVCNFNMFGAGVLGRALLTAVYKEP